MENNNTEQDAEQDEKKIIKKSNGKKILLWILGIVFTLILIMLAIAAWVCAALFDQKPLPIVKREVDLSQYNSCIAKFKIQRSEGESAEAAYMKDKTVDLSQDEVNAILNSLTAGAREYLAVKSPKTSIADIHFKNGALYADVSQEATFATPFGKYMNMKLTMIPRIENQHMYLDVTNLSVGSMVVSGNYVQEFIDNDLKNFEKTENGQTVITMLKRLELDDDSVKVTFNPMQISMFLMQKALSIFSESGNDEGSDLSDLLKLLQ